jgi:hypothetical protein
MPGRHSRIRHRKAVTIERNQTRCEADRIRAVLALVTEHICDELTEIDTEKIADCAVESGLMRHVPYDPGKHNIGDEVDCEPGEMIYYWGDE